MKRLPGSEAWIEGRFEGIYTGSRPRPDPDLRDARRFDLELLSGTVFEPRPCDEPEAEEEAAEAALPQPAIALHRLRRVELRPPTGASREATLFDVRIRDWRLTHPAESKGRTFGTLVGTLQARLRPAAPDALDDAPTSLAGPTEASPERELPSTVDRTALPSSASLAQGASEVTSPEPEVWLARLRWGAALALLLLLAAGLALFCGLRAAALGCAPIAAALLLRRLARPVRLRRSGAAFWLGVACLGCQAIVLLPLVQATWSGSCWPPMQRDFLWAAGPLIVAGLFASRWPLVLTALVWIGVTCVGCAAPDGTCSATADSSAAEVCSRAPTPAPRTDADGRWPVMPSASPPGATPPSVPLPSVPQPSTRQPSSQGPAIQRPSIGVPSPQSPTFVPPALDAPTRETTGPAAEMPQTPPTTATSPPVPSAGTRPRPGSSAVEGAEAPMATYEGTASGVPSATPGGWVAPDHRRTDRVMVRISIEQANRNPDAFFGNEGRRVYLPTDAIFESGGSRIRRGGDLELTRLANLLRLHPERPVEIEVHTDASGGAREQVALSQRRAEAVRAWLLDRGHLEGDALRVAGVGGAHPIVPPDGSHAAQQPNRRLEVRLLD